MQQFESRGKTYNLPDTATHAAPGACVGLYFKDGDSWYFMGDVIGDVPPKKCGVLLGFYDNDVVELKPKRVPFAFWNKIKGALFKWATRNCKRYATAIRMAMNLSCRRSVVALLA
ncbi:hypothetical protein RCIP0092_00060 [Klebsiella phage RCIP0092]